MVRKTIILGSGCAGSTAAVYAARANLEPLVLEGHEPGGQLSLTTLVENFPGFPEGVIGPELVENIKKQAQRFGSDYIMERAVAVDLNQKPFAVRTDENEFKTHSIIIASGASARMLGLDSEKKLIGRGVSTCATCDGYFFRGQKVVVVGGGDTAMEDSLFLTKHAEKVTIIHRRDQLRASRIMAERAMNNPKIEFLWDTVVTDVLDVEKGGVEAVRLKNVKSGEESVLATNGLFVAIGHQPNTGIFQGLLDMDENGYLIVDNHSRTNIEGVFAAGDVHDHVYRQAITAAGAGCRAAIECERYLQAKGIE
jgi:thioredoxin reductase (NADPH)